MPDLTFLVMDKQNFNFKKPKISNFVYRIYNLSFILTYSIMVRICFQPMWLGKCQLKNNGFYDLFELMGIILAVLSSSLMGNRLIKSKTMKHYEFLTDP